MILNYFFADQTLWYENFILFFYLIIFLLSFYYKKYKKTGFLIGLLVALSSFIKPTAAIIIVPLIFYFKDLMILISFSILWFLFLMLFFIKKSLPLLIKNLFFFNFYISKNYPKEKIFDFNFLLVFFFLLFFSLIVAYKERRIKKFFCLYLSY